MRLVALDLETTGLNPQEDQILEAGMVCFESDTGEIVGEFETLVRHPRYEGGAHALAMNAQLFRDLADGRGIGLSMLREWFQDNLGCCLGYGNLNKPHAVGFNVAPFDIAFLKASNIDVFHHRAIELGSLLQKTFAEYSPISSKAFTAREGGEVAHTALADCHMARRAYGHALCLNWAAL